MNLPDRSSFLQDENEAEAFSVGDNVLRIASGRFVALSLLAASVIFSSSSFDGEMRWTARTTNVPFEQEPPPRGRSVIFNP